MTDSAKAPSKGALRAATDLIGSDQGKLYIHAQVFKGWAEAHDIAAIIDRETKAGEMAESLKWALGNISKPTLIKGQNDAHVAAYERAERLLTELEGKL